MLERESENTEYISPNMHRGFGDTFRARTVKTVNGQTRHSRVVAFVSTKRIYCYSLLDGDAENDV